MEPVSLNNLLKYSVHNMKACKKEEACSFSTKANHKERRLDERNAFQMLVSSDEQSPGEQVCFFLSEQIGSMKIW